jgi:hypothetical protein
MFLADFTSLADSCRESGGGFAAFGRGDRVLDLGWPTDVVEQWLYDHSNKGAFLQDYATGRAVGHRRHAGLPDSDGTQQLRQVHPTRVSARRRPLGLMGIMP